jgi:hypothetical protein
MTLLPSLGRPRAATISRSIVRWALPLSAVFFVAAAGCGGQVSLGGDDAGPDMGVDHRADWGPGPYDSGTRYDSGLGYDSGFGYDSGIGYDTAYDSGYVYPDAPVLYDVGIAPYDIPADAFARLKLGMVGTWEGVRTNPWEPPAWVRITFEESGHYSARCLDGGGSSCTALNRGVDDDHPGKTYRPFDLYADGSGVARIQLYFGATFAEELLDGIVLDPALRTMSMELHQGSGTNHYELHRTSW